MNVPFPETSQDLDTDSAALTERGQRRELNEDAVYHRTDQMATGDTIGLYLVCDGLGGHQAGEVASRLAIKTVASELEVLLFGPEVHSKGSKTLLSPASLQQITERAITKAHLKIKAYAERHPFEAANLGTTIALALVYGDSVHIANVGDSRVYAWRAGQLTQITSDHSMAAKLFELGEIEASEIAEHPWSSVLSQALGTEEALRVDHFDWNLQAGDRLLLCSDGLWQAFPESDDLAWWMGLEESPVDLCWRLVLEANRRDGSDNISAVVVTTAEAITWPERFMGRKLASLLRESV